MLRVSLPETADIVQIEHEIVYAATDRLRDDHGYELCSASIPLNRETRHEYRLRPTGSVVVERDRNVLNVRLNGIDVDSKDLFTAVCGDIEQRHSGLETEID